MDNKSEKVVLFLSNLDTHFQGKTVDGKFCSERTTDGTLVLCPEDSEAREQGHLVVYWQGDPNRKTVVLSQEFVREAVIDYVDRRSRVEIIDDKKAEIDFMFRHFGVKTGIRIKTEKEGALRKTVKALKGILSLVLRIKSAF
jgi:hypothetical protein